VLVTISTTHEPATRLADLLGKRLDRVETSTHPFGTGTVFFPEATSARCSAALLLEADADFPASPTVLAMAIATAFSTTSAVAEPILLEVAIPAVRCG
jgi:hypothetical protein